MKTSKNFPPELFLSLHSLAREFCIVLVDTHSEVRHPEREIRRDSIRMSLRAGPALHLRQEEAFQSQDQLQTKCRGQFLESCPDAPPDLSAGQLGRPTRLGVAEVGPETLLWALIHPCSPVVLLKSLTNMSPGQRKDGDPVPLAEATSSWVSRGKSWAGRRT